ncbi:MAG: tetratricopeptide repeat protein [Tatlockia sp.]|nr:tetratricopeptide repeat protein [Tatlockia sp.]
MTIRADNKDQLATYLHFLEQDPDNFNLLISIIDGYRKMGDFARAQLYLEKAKAIDSDACFAQQGFIDISLGNFSLAKEALVKALAKEDLAILRYSLAICHYSLNEPIEGIGILSPLLVNGSSNYEVELLVAKMMRQQSRLDEAIKLLEAAIEHHGPASDSLALLSEIYFDKQELELAEKTAQQALIIEPGNYEALVILLLLRLAEGKTTVREIKTLLIRQPEDAYLWFALGVTFMREMKVKKAEEAFLKAAELDPFFSENWISLGWCQLCLDKIKKAEFSYQQIIATNEEIAEGWGGLALVASLRSDLAEAERLIAKAKQLDQQSILADIALIIHSNFSDPADAGKKFKKTFPTVAEQIHAAMDMVLAEMEGDYTSVH